MDGAPASDLGFDFSGVELRISGLPPALADRLNRDWAGFESTPAADPLLRVETRVDAGPLLPAGDYRPKEMSARLDQGAARFAMPEGRVEVDDAGRALLQLAPTVDERDYFTLLNLLRACLAWRLPSRGGVLLHAAGLVLDGRAFAMAGAEGSGKTTWARLGEAGGAHVLSDDVVLIDGRDGDAVALGSPLRSTHPIRHRRGRWPLTAILFPRKARSAARRPVSPLLARARIVANLPFVVGGLERDERLGAVIERLVSQVDCAELSFARDGGFVELLRQWGSPAESG